nr:tRNA (guanosine(46)-N7)-methyltransferase TrmB [Mycobacterium lepromatosis]
MRHHGQMHAQPEMRLRPATPVTVRSPASPNCGADSYPSLEPCETNRPEPGSEQSGAARYLPVIAFRTRHSALSQAQRQTWERLWPEIGISVVPQTRSGERLDTDAWFGRSAPVVLEIGCGSGTATLAMAQHEPDIDVIAVEVYRRGLAQLLCAINRDQVHNIRMIHGNALYLLQHLIAPMSLTGVRVFFPDPWPKARHHKRRLLQPATVELIADRLLPGGVLHTATDHPDYAEQIAEVGDGEPLLSRADGSTQLPIATVRPTTKYETKAQHAGNIVTELIWKKRS